MSEVGRTASEPSSDSLKIPCSCLHFPFLKKYNQGVPGGKVWPFGNEEEAGGEIRSMDSGTGSHPSPATKRSVALDELLNLSVPFLGRDISSTFLTGLVRELGVFMHLKCLDGQAIHRSAVEMLFTLLLLLRSKQMQLGSLAPPASIRLSF